MSARIELNRIITEKIESLSLEPKVKKFLNEILNFERSVSNLEGRVPYSEQYKKMIEKFAKDESPD